MIVIIYYKECGCDVDGFEFINDCVKGVDLAKDAKEGEEAARKLLDEGWSKVELWDGNKLLKTFWP